MPSRTAVAFALAACCSLLLSGNNAAAFAPSRPNGIVGRSATLPPPPSGTSFAGLPSRPTITTSALRMAETSEKESSLPMLLDPGTRGGALFLSLVLFIVPILGYNVVTSVFGVDEIEAGKWIGVGFTLVTLVLWVSTYIFRVATKDMTYAKQLKDYENAVIAKRLEELDEDEVQALVEDIERDDF